MKLTWPPTVVWTRNHTLAAIFAAILALLLVLSTCSPTVPVKTRVDAQKLLRVATFNSPTTYYVGAAGPTGFEYDLTRAFAEELGAEVEILIAETPSEVVSLLLSGRAHLGAGLTVTPTRRMAVQFTPPLREVAPQLVYRAGTPRPKNLYELEGELVVPADTATAEALRSLADINPELRWTETAEFGTEQLLFQVARGEIAYTLSPSDLVAINRRYYPELRVAFSLPDTQHIAWAFAPGDDSLYPLAVAFLERLDQNELNRVRDRYFGHVAQVGTYGALTLATHTQTRLPRYRSAFEEAAAEHGLDWRLLAAVGYQESHWNPAAVSPTGVRGLMQITMDTAEYLRIRDRLDPIQSIYGAARYLQQLHERLPPEIPEPDRTWMTLAAYNIGFGHVMDVRRIVEQQNGNPNRWIDVREHLPLLTQPRWHRQTRHGYARGHEAVTYVGNIRTYYDMLTWITGGPLPAAIEAGEEAPPERKEKEKEPLNIISPVL
jgi:membrane-bound lytic murein transglycosylase F